MTTHLTGPQSESEVTQSCLTLCNPMDSGACSRLHCPWDFLGKSTGVGCHFLLQGIFLTQGSDPGLPHCRQILYRLSLQRSSQGHKYQMKGFLWIGLQSIPFGYFCCTYKYFLLLLSESASVLSPRNGLSQRRQFQNNDPTI